MQIDFQRLKYFICAAEKLNFNQAAKQLFVSPQALNKQILKLEDELGLKLFERTTRKVSLTDDGKKLYQIFSSVVGQYDIACRQFEKYQSSKDKIIRIGYFRPIPRQTVVAKVVNYLRLCDHQFHVEILTGELEEVSDWLLNDKIDLCITNIHEYEHWTKNLKEIQIWTEPAMLVTSLYHPWVVKEEPITEKDMKEYPMIFMKPLEHMKEDNLYRKLYRPDSIIIQSFDATNLMLQTGNYYAIYPRLFGGGEGKNIKTYPLPEKYRFDFRMSLVYSPDNKFAPYFEELGENLDELDLSLKD